MRKILPPKKTLGNGFSKLWNKQFLIFLFFLGLSTSFWLFQALNEMYEREFSLPLKMQNVPENVVITTELPEHINITLRDKGGMLFNYRYGIGLKPIIIDFEKKANAGGHVQIRMTEVLKELAKRLPSSTEIVSAKPDTLEFFYNYGLCKRVPVRLLGNVETDRLYYLSHHKLCPDSVTVYATKSQLDTITAAYLQPAHFEELADTTSFRAEIIAIKGAKFEPSSIDVSLYVDRLVEKTVQVPIQWINFPTTKALRTFPSKVNITFQVGMGMYRNITADDFVVSVDYEELMKSTASTCSPKLQTVPQGITHARINPVEVEYVIEDISARANNL